MVINRRLSNIITIFIKIIKSKYQKLTIYSFNWLNSSELYKKKHKYELTNIVDEILNIYLLICLLRKEKFGMYELNIN